MGADVDNSYVIAAILVEFSLEIFLYRVVSSFWFFISSQLCWSYFDDAFATMVADFLRLLPVGRT